MRRNDPALQRKLLAWLLSPLLALLLLDSVVTYATSAGFSNQAYDRALHEIAREVFLHVQLDGGRARFDISAGTERLLMTDQDDRLFYKVSSSDGRLIGGDEAIAPPRTGVPGKDGAVFYDDVVHGMEVRMVAARMAHAGNGAPGWILVQVGETLNKRQRLATEIRASVLVPQLLLIVLAILAVCVGVRQGLKPLQMLTRAVSNRSHLDLSPVDDHDVPAEVRPLVAEVNGLLQRLDATLNFQNRFIADAAHQLKTPVAGMKAQIELALRGADSGKLQHAVAQLYVSADRLSRLVGQLLSLARNEPGAVENVKLLPLDLHALALEITMEWVPEALKRNIDLGFEGADGRVMIDGDTHRLRELINNLIDNAVRYSQDGGTVTVHVINGSQPTLSISDDGPRIPVEERTRIFERFHRLLGTQVDGSGLGLAIVSEIATVHHARITLEEDKDGVGNAFTVLFPASGSADNSGTML